MATDWAKTVRSLRLRLRLKQGALAELIGVSQTSVSRLEAGLVAPTPAVAKALTKLAADPRTRSLFDDLRATVDHSPFPCLLVQTGHAGPQIEAISADMSREFMGGRTRISDAPALGRLISDLNLLARGGVEDGQMLGATAVWADPVQDNCFWQVRYTPIRDETGASFMHVTLAGLDDSPAARAAANDAAPRIERLKEN